MPVRTQGETVTSGVMYWLCIGIIVCGLYLLVWWPHHLLGGGDTPVPWLAWLLRPRGLPPLAHGDEATLAHEPPPRECGGTTPESPSERSALLGPLDPEAKPHGR